MAQPLLQTSELTLLEWAGDDATPGEFDHGHRTDEEVPTQTHEEIVLWLLLLFSGWKGAGRVRPSETKFIVAAEKGRKADVSVFLPGSVPSRRAKAVTTPPFIAVEVLSEGHADQIRDRVEKLFEYAAFGVHFYWLVDPDLRIVTVHELGADGRYAIALSASAGQHAVPGCESLVLDLDALWAKVDELPE